MKLDRFVLRHFIKDLLTSGYDVRINASGTSMLPFIRTGDKITIRPGKTMNVGDIIVFSRNDGMICHRLIKITKKGGVKYYQTCGDSFFTPDEPVGSSQILGKVVKIERERISLIRRALLFIYPVLRICKLNALVISTLIMVKNIFQLTTQDN